MTLYEFNDADEAEQLEAVWDGTHIGERADDEHNILLYQVYSFYVEVYYHREYNIIRRFRSFSSTEQLKPYLDKIDVLKQLNSE